MITFVIISLFVFIIISFVKTKRFTSPAVVFNSFWFILLFLAGLRLFGLYSFSDGICILILIGCFSFTVGSFLFPSKLLVRNNSSPLVQCKPKDVLINKKILTVLLIVCFATLLYRFSFQIPYLKNGISISNIRYIEKIQYPPLVGILFNYFTLPFLDACIVILFVRNIVQKKSIIHYILPIFLLLISIISNGARLAIYQLLVAIVFSIILCRKVSIKVFFLATFLLFVILAAFIFITSGRNGNSSIISLLQSAYNYFCGSIVFADSVLTNQVGMNEYLYGFNSFGGVIRPFYAILGLFGIDEPSYLSKAGLFMADSMQKYVIAVGESSPLFNYFCTCFIYFYKDGGYLGVAIIGILYGLISTFIYSRLLKYKSFGSLILYVFIIISLLTSMMHFSFSYFIYVMSIFYACLILFKRKKSHNCFTLTESKNTNKLQRGIM